MMSDQDTGRAHAFHLQEHEHIRREIEADKDYLRKLNLYVVVGTGTVWSWLLINGDLDFSAPEIVASGLPILFAIFGWWRTHGLIASIEIKAEYLRKLETEMPRLARLEGWETWWHATRPKKPHRQDWAFWTTLVLITIIAPLLYFFLIQPAADRHRNRRHEGPAVSGAAPVVPSRATPPAAPTLPGRGGG